jgi:Xaa-Pro aminopeptidase
VARTDAIGIPIPRAELERRWTAVRASMREQGVDALAMQHNNPASGYLRYFTDLVAGGNPTSVVFPLEGDMTLVRHGAMGGDRDLLADPDDALPGIGRVRTTAHFNAAGFTRRYDADLIIEALAPHAHGTIGLLGSSEMSYAFGSALVQGLPRARFIDASEIVDRVKVIKSEEEQRRVRAAAALQDGAMAVALEAIRPGVRERDVVAAAMRWSIEHGSDYGTYMIGSGPPGTPAPPHPLHLQNRTIGPGDIVTLLIENTGPGGYYAELGRTAVVGHAPPELAEELEFALAAQRATLERLTPGTPCAVVWEAHNAFMREHGRPEETRIHCHGQGYDLVERPLVRFDEPMSVGAGMNFACHPAYANRGVWSWICDNYIVGEDGTGTCLHRTARRIFEV